jgi:hypothetical protein
MRRRAFEFNDLAWCPQTWRQILTACTGFFGVAFDIFRPILPRLADGLRDCAAAVILDLCSGAAGPLVLLQRQLAEREGCRATVVLSDKYPNLDVFGSAVRRSDGAVRFIEDSVDAAAPRAGEAFRTIFTAFHHFEPEKGCRIPQDAARNRVGIGVFEYTERSLVWDVSALLAPLFCWLTASVGHSPVHHQGVLLIAWDGIVSGLRAYDPDTFRLLVSRADAPD